MKKHFGILAFLITAISATAQPIRLSGTITGEADENLWIEYPKDWFGNTWKEEVKVSENAFSKEAEIAASGWMRLSYKDKDRSFFLWKKATGFHIEFNADFLDGEVSTSGDAAPVADLMAVVKEKFGSRFSDQWLKEQAKDATNIDAMEMEAFAVRNDVLHVLKSFQQDIPEQFSTWFKNHAGYYYYLSLFRFAEAKTESSAIPKATEIPKVLLEGLNWERMNLPEELDSEFYRHLLVSFVNYKALEQYDFMKFADVQSKVQAAFNLARENLEGQNLQYFLTHTLLSQAEYVQPSLLRQMNDHLLTTPNAEVYVKLVGDSLEERLRAKDDAVAVRVVEDKKSGPQIDVEVIGLDGRPFKLSDLRGKVVYLDIWASWCGPCRKQFPASKAMKEQLSKKEKKQIEFLYISIDNTETVWKKAIEELGIDGVHGLSQGGWGSQVTAKFGVNSIPRYLILDKQGNIVDANAPRPSDPRTIEILRKLAAQ